MKRTLFFIGLLSISFFSKAQEYAAFGIVGRAAMDVIDLKDLNEAIASNIEILDRVSVKGTFLYDTKNKPLLYNQDKSFELQFRPTDGEIRFKAGALLLGYFSREIGETTVLLKTGLASVVPSDPEAIARMYTQYLLIKKVESLGGDLLLGPVVTTSVDVVDKNTDKITVEIYSKAVRIKSIK
ncbi:MAG: hypothetical protein RIC15_00225 [Vicingaceae bacterium]